MSNELFDKVVDYANKNVDGHFTLMKFTGNWRACFGTIELREQIGQMAVGKTRDEALQNLLDNPVSVYDMKF